MRNLIVFNMMSLDGYIADSKGDMSWAHKHDEEWNSFAASNASGDAVLLFGRATYDMMARYWPSEIASKSSPVVAKRMNELQKIVFSKTMDKASWSNTTLVKGDLVTEVKRLKQQPGAGMVILGSASIVAQLTSARLIDEYQIAVNPVILGCGKSMFAGITEKLNLKLSKSRTFGNGNVFLSYEPAK